MARRARPRFKRGDRVEWDEDPGAGHPKIVRTGEVRDTHNLGGYGYAYEVAPERDHGFPSSIELEEVALRTTSVLEQVAEAAAEPMRTGLPKSKRRKKS